MFNNVKAPFTGADIWITAPFAFIFLVGRLINEQYGNFDHENLLNFLGTDDDEIRSFLANPIMIPIEWVSELAKTSKGNDLLDKFNSLPKKRIRDNDFVALDESCQLLDEDSVVEVLLGKGNPCNLSVDFTDELLGDLHDLVVNLSVEKEKTLADASAAFLDKKSDDSTSSDIGHNGRKNEIVESKKVKTGRKRGKKKTKPGRDEKKIVIDPKIQFLAGLHRIIGAFDEYSLSKVLGGNGGVSRFKSTGEIPSE